MDDITKLYDETLLIVEALHTVDYEQLLELVELREIVLHEIKPQSAVKEDEQRMLHQIGEFDEAILARMKELLEEASQGIQRIAKTRMQKKKYEHAHTHGSFFVDYRE